VHDVFASVGASNVTWVWCPNVDPAGKLHDLASLYPGDEYVDWTGLDGYNWGPSKGGWTSFSRLYSTTYHEITDTIAPSKPLLIGEMGSTEQGGSKAAWIGEALTEIPTAFPKVRAALWFDTYDDGMDWPIETSSSATSAFAGGVANPAYRANSYADLPPGPIAPPS
jgi:mannan endo-1,4-beta-mannosidase